MVEYIPETVEAVVIGSGAGGAVAAAHMSSAKKRDGRHLRVVLLEAGPRIAPQSGWENYSDLPVNMLFNPAKYKWPFLRVANPIMYEFDAYGNPTDPLMSPYGPITNKLTGTMDAWGVGGTTQMYLANTSRGYRLGKWDSEVPLPLNELAPYLWTDEMLPYYQRNEAFLSVIQPMGCEKRFDTKNAITLVGANKVRIGPTDPIYSYFSATLTSGPNGLYIPMFNQTTGMGYRGQPNAITEACWHCGNCMTGCWKQSKQSTTISYIPYGEQNKMEVRKQSFAIAVLHLHPEQVLPEDHTDHPSHLVVYGTYLLGPDGPARDGNGYIMDIHIQPTEVVVFAGGGIETPRLWLQSNYLLKSEQPFAGILTTAGINLSVYQDALGNTLPSHPDVGKNLRSGETRMMVFRWDKPINMWVGQNNMSKADIPEVGVIESYAFPPAYLGVFATADPTKMPYDENNIQIKKFGVQFKERVLKQFAYLSYLAITPDDYPALEQNRVFLDPAKFEYIHETGSTDVLTIPVPAFQYRPPAKTEERTEMLGELATRMMQAVSNVTKETEPKLVETYNIRSDSTMAVMLPGTMQMGKVVNSDCEAIGAPGIYIADISVFPSVIGIGQPTHTIQALALRTAEAACKKLLTDSELRKWKDKVGTGHFLP